MYIAFLSSSKAAASSAGGVSVRRFKDGVGGRLEYLLDAQLRQRRALHVLGGPDAPGQRVALDDKDDATVWKRNER